MEQSFRGSVVSSKKRIALDFINSIESTWKGHLPFAFWLIQKIKPKTVVDLGFDRGLSTIAFAYRNRGHVFGIDWFDHANYVEKSFALDSAFRNISNAIRFRYAKNIHLIVGPFAEIVRTWTRSIDILHIDWAHTYKAAKQQLFLWNKFFKNDGILLVHDVLSCPNETGRFFQELPMEKVIFPYSQGLGVASNNSMFMKSLKQTFVEDLSQF